MINPKRSLNQAERIDGPTNRLFAHVPKFNARTDSYSSISRARERRDYVNSFVSGARLQMLLGAASHHI